MSRKCHDMTQHDDRRSPSIATGMRDSDIVSYCIKFLVYKYFDSVQKIRKASLTTSSAVSDKAHRSMNIAIHDDNLQRQSWFVRLHGS